VPYDGTLFFQNPLDMLVGRMLKSFRYFAKYGGKMNGIDAEVGRAAMFKALGDPTRLRIFEFLRSCCGPVSVGDTGEVRPVDGPTVGEVCCQVTGVERITSTISHHLKELRQAGLITMERRGKNMICGINQEAVAALAGYLADSAAECCEDEC